jgi:hypothetical protein
MNDKREDMSEQYGFYKSINNQELESSFHRDNNFITSIRGIKVRGVFDTIDEAKNRSEFIKKIDNKQNTKKTNTTHTMKSKSHTKKSKKH